MNIGLAVLLVIGIVCATLMAYHAPGFWLLVIGQLVALLVVIHYSEEMVVLRDESGGGEQ